MSENENAAVPSDDSLEIRKPAAQASSAEQAMEKAAESYVKADNVPEYADQQTIKQPVYWFCSNPECRENPIAQPSKMFKFERDEPKCPKCTSGPPVVHKMSLIHLLVPSRDGLIMGDMKRRFMIACDPKRDYIATRRNGEAGSGDPNCITCPGCIDLVKKYIEKIVRDRVVLKQH